jgi:hypothetical protein
VYDLRHEQDSISINSQPYITVLAYKEDEDDST